MRFGVHTMNEADGGLFVCLQVLQPVLSDPDKEPALRLSLLQLLDSLLEGPSTAAVFVSSSSNAELTLHALLMPPVVWRAGKVRVGPMLCWRCLLVANVQVCAMQLSLPSVVYSCA